MMSTHVKQRKQARRPTRGFAGRCLLALLAITCSACQTTRPPTADLASLHGGPAEIPTAQGPQIPAAPIPGGAMTPQVMPVAYYPPALPANAWTGQPAMLPEPGSAACCPPSVVAMDEGAATTNWRPPHLPAPWPRNEYLFDGGDKPPEVDIMPDWTVRGLAQEDTIAHFDTLDGHTEVVPSNRVAIYAPRFAAIRRVDGLLAHETHHRPAGMEMPTRINQQEQRSLATTVNQPLQPGRYLGMDSSQSFRERVQSGGVVANRALARANNRFRPYEDFQLIRDGLFENEEKARLATRLAAAAAWTEKQAVQVTLNGLQASVAINDTAAQSVYEYEVPPGKSRLRIVKVASRENAQPGDEVEFTLRFDNVGDQLIGNVTVIDNLTTRLEYVDDTAQCSLPGRFMTDENEGKSLVLRWEIDEPLDVGQGGIIRFTCRVR